jgi:cytoskeletal protein CcmA (bactofilin family)
MRDLTTADFDWNDDAATQLEAASLVDRHSSFEGTYRTQRDLRVDGEVKGSISCDGTLHVAEGATVSATVDAEHISVAGDLSGEIRCRGRLLILPSGRVRARVTTGSLVIQEGAVYEGQIDMAGVERPAPLPLRARPTIGPVSTDSGTAERQPGNGTTFIRRLGSPEAPWESTSDDPTNESRLDETPEGPAG